MRRAAAGIALSILSVACANAPPPASTVERSGFSIRHGSLGVAALIRLEGSAAREAIPLEVAFFDGEDQVALEEGGLPFCLPDTDCWWAESYTTLPANITRVDVTAGDGIVTTAEHRIVPVDQDGTRAPAGGTHFVIDTGPPMWGTSVLVERGDRIDAGHLYVGAAGDRGEPGAD